MLTRREALAATALAALFVAASARAQDRLNVIASFSILGDLVKNVGGDRVEVATLVGPNGNAHVYAPSPGDAKKVADAKLVFVNGLGFEGWLERLVKASGTKAPIVVATKGIKPLERAGEHGHDHDHGRADPHAWQSVANAKIYVANIRDALIAADPSGKDAYLAQRSAPPCVVLCTLTVDDHRSASGQLRYMLGGDPIERMPLLNDDTAKPITGRPE